MIGGVSYALDVTEGERPGHAARSCLIGMRLAQALGLDSATRSHLFYALLLKDAGCSANSARMAALFGADDHVAKRTSKRVNWSGKFPAFVWAVRTVAPRGSPRARIDRLRAIKDEGQVTRALMQARCDSLHPQLSLKIRVFSICYETPNFNFGTSSSDILICFPNPLSTWLRVTPRRF